MADNLEIWNKLGKTDPKHTKRFKRAGGFGGTAIKPIYTIEKMTEVFGPVGQGWGTDEPLFQVVPGNEGQVAVYCTVALWTGDKNNGRFYGVGGDMVVVKQSSGLRTDDEAFKKAFTDAIGNAMKHLGMSADVHMGLFDDSKYVSDLEAELADEVPPRQLVKVTREAEKDMRVEIDACSTVSDLESLWRRPDFKAEYDKLHQTYKDGLLELFKERKEMLVKHPFVAPDFDNLPDETKAAVRNARTP